MRNADTGTTEQKLTVGLDVGDVYTQVCVLDERGDVVEEARIQTTPRSFRQRFRTMPSARLVLEAGTHSPWSSRLLAELGHEVIVANPRMLQSIEHHAEELPRSVAEALGVPFYSLRGQLEFERAGRYIFRRLFAELFGTFLLVLVAAGASVVNARFGGQLVPPAAQVVAPGLMVMSIILFMGAVSGAHLNPVVSIAFALREDFAWRRVPGYIGAQLAGAVLAMEVLVLLLGRQGAAGLTLPGVGVSTPLAMAWEIFLTLGLVSVILGTASGAQNVGWGAAIGVGGYIALAGLVGFPVSGASMNPARSLGPALVVEDYTGWWAYLAGPLAGALIAVGFAWALRGRGGGIAGRRAGSGTLGELWQPGPIGPSTEKAGSGSVSTPEGPQPESRL